MKLLSYRLITKTVNYTLANSFLFIFSNSFRTILILRMRNLMTWTAAVLLCMGTTMSGQTSSYSTQSITKDLEHFKDWSASELADGFKMKHLKEFHSPLMQQLAKQLKNGTYQSRYLLNSYKPIPSNEVLKKTLKLYNGYSQYENITGVYLEQGENVVLVGDLHGRKVKLLIADWMRQPTSGYKPTEDPEGWGLKRQAISLHEGVNVIYVEKAGNVYLDYFADDPETAPEITIHFVTGKANGYFDAETQNNEDWKNLLTQAVSPVLDIKTQYMQLAYPVEFLKEFRPEDGKELAEAYDKIMEQQYTFNGAIKYDRIPPKRILARVNFNYFMFRDDDGVAFLGDKATMKSALGPDIYSDWGVNHEIGHVMQMSPQLTWGGMTEVSNNLFTMYVSQEAGMPSRLSKSKNYENAFKHVLEAEEKPFIMCVSDPFEKLVPFWQLYLYAKENGYPDFYADLMEHMRNHPDKGRGNESIQNMYEFIKISCDLLKTDLTDFFEAWGFFVTGTFEIGDYTNYTFHITQKMIDETKQYIASKRYNKPEKDVTRITD